MVKGLRTLLAFSVLERTLALTTTSKFQVHVRSFSFLGTIRRQCVATVTCVVVVVTVGWQQTLTLSHRPFLRHDRSPSRCTSRPDMITGTPCSAYPRTVRMLLAGWLLRSLSGSAPVAPRVPPFVTHVSYAGAYRESNRLDASLKFSIHFFVSLVQAGASSSKCTTRTRRCANRR
jgi:hypothetical protein